MVIFDKLNIPHSGMMAQKLKIELISENIANSDTIMTLDGDVYKRKTPIFEEIYNFEKNSFEGVKVKSIIKENSEGILKYEPNHPLADKNGYVKYPDINIIRELTDLINAQRAYEANLAVFNSIKSIINKSLEI